MREKAKSLIADSEVIERRIEAAEQLFNLLGVLIPDDVAEAVESQRARGGEDMAPSSPKPPDSVSELADGDEEAPTVDATGKRVTVINFVEEGVIASPTGLPIYELKAQLMDSPIGRRLMENDKGFYRSIDRLSAKGRIVRSNGRVFSKDAFAHYQAKVDAGEIVDAPARLHIHSPMGDAIEAIVKSAPGIQAASLISKLREDAEFAAALTPHTTGAYNVLARLVKRGQIIKLGRLYFPPGSEIAPENAGDSDDDGIIG